MSPYYFDGVVIQMVQLASRHASWTDYLEVVCGALMHGVDRNMTGRQTRVQSASWPSAPIVMSNATVRLFTQSPVSWSCMLHVPSNVGDFARA